MDKTELRSLQLFFRRALGNESLRVALDPKNTDQAQLSLGERQIGTIIVDDEDDDRSFALSLQIPVERAYIQDYLRTLFENDRLKIVPRGRKSDSVELMNGEDFLGIISADDPAGKSFTFQMAVLDFDLEDL
jgi:hypothetical protein